MASGWPRAYALLTGERTTVSRLLPPTRPSAPRQSTGVAVPSTGTSRSGWNPWSIAGRAILYHSPDEGTPYGTERLIWSRDGTKLLLVGRHFFVKDDLFLDNGDQLYFLYVGRIGQVVGLHQERQRQEEQKPINKGLWTAVFLVPIVIVSAIIALYR